MIPNILAQCAGAAAAASSATKLRGYPTGAIPIAPDGDIWTIFVVEGTDEFSLNNKIYQKNMKIEFIFESNFDICDEFRNSHCSH